MLRCTCISPRQAADLQVQWRPIDSLPLRFNGGYVDSTSSNASVRAAFGNAGNPNDLDVLVSLLPG